MSSDAPITENKEEEEQVEVWPDVVDLELHLPGQQVVSLSAVNVTENLSSVRQALAEFQETAFLTCFQWQLRAVLDAEGNALQPAEDNEQAQAQVVQEFNELSSFMQAQAKKLVFALVHDLYDAKKVRAHVKRVRDTIQRQFLLSATQAAAEVEKEQEQQEQEQEESKEKENKEKAHLPKLEALPETDLGAFFSTALKTDVSKTALETPSLPLSAAIKSIFVSGWNPVPAARRLQGDLLYLEVSFANEGTVYITATTKGFYVNRSNRASFDPTPANHPHYYHDLFDTLCAVSPAVKLGWQRLCEQSVLWASAPMDAFVSQLSQAKEHPEILPAGSWIVPGKETTEGGNALAQSKPTYDMLRAQESLCDLHGVEELGAPREWNDEIQSIRALQANDLQARLLQARLEHRMITEFTEACKKIVVGISDGLIAPLTYSDPSQSDMFVYNGIFFSRAEDTKDFVGVLSNEEAARKCAARDLQNQKLVRALEVPGLGSILSAIVDYKGARYVGQSIIPGLISQGEYSASLLYGVLEKDKPVTVKNASLQSFEELGKKLQLGKRNIPLIPFKSSPEDAAAAAAAAAESAEATIVDPLVALLKTSETAAAAPIKVDEVDNVPVENDSVPHVGPIEAKLIKGADGRTYVLEMIRLTPRDANYVRKEQGGSEQITEEQLARADERVFSTYVLRQELIGIFLQRKVNLARQALFREISQKAEDKKSEADKEKKESETGASSSSSGTAAAVEDVSEGEEEDENAVQIVKDKKQKEIELDEAAQEQIAAEYRERFTAITPESLNIEVNPNVFVEGFAADVNAEVLQKDEALAREMATFLYDSVLPMLTRQVREGDISPKDSDSLVRLLHRMGVNMRYLGRLAQLALEQEREDAELMFQNKQRVHSMPYFWLEFLTVELFARAAKHMLNEALKKDASIAAAPAATIAALLNLFVSVLKEPTIAAAEKETPAIAAAPAVETKTEEVEKKSSKKKSKKTAASATASSSSSSSSSSAELSFAPVLAADVSSRETFVARLNELLVQKFLYDSPLLAPAPTATPETLDDKTAFVHMHTTLLRSRISPIMLVRRICQQCGIVLSAKSYELKTAPLKEGVAKVFSANDVQGLVPKVKSCEPETYLAELPEMISSSSALLSQGNAVGAFELAQQALNLVAQITGPVHPHALQATEQLTAVLVNSADFKSSAQMTTRALSLTAQVHGVDNQNVIFHHIQLALLETELGNLQLAFDHLTTAKYLLEIVGGKHHPDMIVIYTRLSVLYEKVGDFESALQALLRARMFVYDLLNNAAITMTIAQLLYRHNRFHEAKHAQTGAFKILKELLPADDERLVEAKKLLETFIRSAAAAPRIAENLAAQGIMNELAEQQHQSGLLGEDGAVVKKKKSTKKSNKTKK